MQEKTVQQEEISIELEGAVALAVEAKTGGVWPRNIRIERFDSALKAAQGKWISKDDWDWIAWQENDAWKVLVSLDGFDCAELETVPAEYADFFHDVVYMFTNSPNGKYCYEHK